MTEHKEKIDARKHAFKVKELASFGISNQDIAKYIGVSRESLVLEYSDILNTAAIDKTIAVAHNLYMLALEGNIPASTFWLKHVGKWEEIAKAKEEISKEDKFDAITLTLLPTKEIDGTNG